MAVFRTLALAGCMFFVFVHPAFSGCNFRTFSDVEDNVTRAYIAYYGRPADSGGLAYWTNRMVSEGGA